MSRESDIREYRLPGKKPQPSELKAGRTFVIHFSNLPDTLQQIAAKSRNVPDMVGAKAPGTDNGPMASFYLPADYSRRRKTPLLLFLQGAYGGPGNWLGEAERELADGTGSIALNIPLFKAPLKSPPRNQADLFLHPRDYPSLSAVYRKVLSAVDRIIPNIDPDHSSLGGFSHGAHAVALLLGFSDKYILSHFHNFILVDQGYPTFFAMATAEDLRQSNILLLVATKGNSPGRNMLLQTSDWIADWGRRANFNVRRVVMKNTPHRFPKRYRRVAINWIRKMNS